MVFDVMGFAEKYGLHAVSPEEFPLAAECCSEAYPGYPLMEYFCHGHYDKQMVFDIMLVNFKSMSKTLVNVSIDEDMSAVLQFMPPEHSREGVSVIDFLKAGGLSLPSKHNRLILFRLMRYEEHCVKIRKKIIDGEFWYLFNLAVRPDFKSMGYGSKLKGAMLDTVDESGLPCYLETHSESNIGYYRRVGFELAHTSILPGAGINHYGMVYRPRR